MTGAWRLRRHESVASTSDLCVALARAGEPEGLAILADRQTGGRGSRGRRWDSPPGNLYLSVLLRPDEDARGVAQWSLLAGVALAESIAALCPAAQPTLKWPNDVLLDGRKLAGVLLDSETSGAGRVEWLVIGMGVNLAAAPDLPGRATIALAEYAPPPAPVDLAETILATLETWRGIRMREGFGPLRAAWLARTVPLGAAIAVKLSEVTQSGDFAGLTEDGSLLLRTGGVTRTFATGEVLFPSLRP